MIGKLRSLYLTVEDDQLLAEQCIFYNQIGTAAGQVLKDANDRRWRGWFCPMFDKFFTPNAKRRPEKDKTNKYAAPKMIYVEHQAA